MNGFLGPTNADPTISGDRPICSGVPVDQKCSPATEEAKSVAVSARQQVAIGGYPQKSFWSSHGPGKSRSKPCPGVVGGRARERNRIRDPTENPCAWLFHVPTPFADRIERERESARRYHKCRRPNRPPFNTPPILSRRRGKGPWRAAPQARALHCTPDSAVLRFPHAGTSMVRPREQAPAVASMTCGMSTMPCAPAECLK